MSAGLKEYLNLILHWCSTDKAGTGVPLRAALAICVTARIHTIDNRLIETDYTNRLIFIGLDCANHHNNITKCYKLAIGLYKSHIVLLNLIFFKD